MTEYTIQQPGGYLYFLRGFGTDYFKVGISLHGWERRLTEIQHSVPFPIAPLFVVQHSMHGSLEKEILYKFKNYQARGEWFNPPGDKVSAFIEDVGQYLADHLFSGHWIHRDVEIKIVDNMSPSLPNTMVIEESEWQRICTAVTNQGEELRRLRNGS